MALKIVAKRAYDAYHPEDGMRILVDRLWPRGVKKDALKHSAWFTDLAPSTELRKFFHADRQAHWDAFAARYADELTHREEATQAFFECVEGNGHVTALHVLRRCEQGHMPIPLDAFEECLRGFLAVG